MLSYNSNSSTALAAETVTETTATKKRKKKKPKKASDDGGPAYSIENYQEEVEAPDDLKPLIHESNVKRAAELKAEEDELIAEVEADFMDEDGEGGENNEWERKKKLEHARKEKWKREKQEEQARADEALKNKEEDDADAPLEDYRDPISEDYKSSYTPLEEETAEDFKFDAEVDRMMDIVVNSLYQNKDVFLRELISNASDALDKIRFMSITKPEMLGDTPEFEVKVQYERDAQTLTIIDTGIGMTKKDLVTNLGTVARSGTSNFLKAAEANDGKADMNMIGQFGVGFYSVFLVADHVKVASKHPDDPVQHVWTSSNGIGSFTVAPDPRGNTLGRGTEITIYLKADSLKYIDPFKLEKLVTHYSEFVQYPISVRTTASLHVTAAVADEEEGDEDVDEEAADSTNSEEDEDDFDGDDGEEQHVETEEVISHSWKRVNRASALWTRNKEDIDESEYADFYRNIARDENANATTYTHFNAEGNINFKSILYLPDELPQQIWDPEAETKSGLKLYGRQVLISDTFKLMPDYLSFIKGVVDSEALPLTVHRETLQESKLIKVIAKKLTRKTIEMVRNLSTKKWPEEDTNDNDDDSDVETEDNGEHPYMTWYKKFGSALKRGVLEDEYNQQRLLKLLRYKTTRTEGANDWRSLKDIVEDMKENQDQIYFLAGENENEMKKSVFLETFKDKDIEVMLLTEPIDEYLFNNLADFEGKRFASITKEGLKIKDEDPDLQKRRKKAYRKKFMPLIKFLQKIYGPAISRVNISDRLVSVPAVVSTADYTHSANMERIMRAQAAQNGQDPNEFVAIKVMEINPRHPYITKLLEHAENDEKPSDEVKDAAWMLHDMALLNSGFGINDVEAYSKRMMRVIGSTISVDDLTLEPIMDVPIEEDVPPAEDSTPGSVNHEHIEL
jgi:heat shock protein beta